jgi:hypothetical protein
MGVQGLDDPDVILGVHDHGHMGVVLGRRADHRGTADVDILDGRGIVRAPGHRRLERVEVHDQKVDRADAMGFHRRHVLGIVAQRQKPAMHLRMQCLDPAVHHLRETGHIGDIRDGQARIPQRRRRAARRQKLHPPVGEGLGEGFEPGLVGHGQKRAADRGECGGSRHRQAGSSGSARLGGAGTGQRVGPGRATGGSRLAGMKAMGRARLQPRTTP